MIQHLKFLGMLFALSILVGCSSAGSSGSGSSPAPTATLSASPASFVIGNGYSTLSFTSTNATQGSINQGVGPVGTNPGSVQVTPPLGVTTYIYTATGPGGTATAQATVTVTPLGPPPTISLQAAPAAIIAGQPVTFTWNSSNATSVAIEPNPGGVQLSGTGTLFPTVTTTYTATATGNYQQTTASQTIQVSPLNSADGMLPDSTNGGQQDIDPNGAVGTKQYMEYVNTEYQAFDKTTLAPVAIAGVSGPQGIGTPFSTALNGPATDCAGTGIQLDAVILFDRLATPNRWVIAAKSVRAAGAQHRYDFCIAVSNTDDVTATNSSGAYTFGWNAYEFQLDGVLGTDSNGTYYFPDWPKLGTWPDAYYAAIDMQDTLNGDAEVGVVVCAFDRVNMIAGNVWNTPQCFQNKDIDLISDGLYLAHSLIPADFDGTIPPQAGRDEFMVSIQNPSLANNMSATTSNTFNLWDFHVDWTTRANTTFTLLTPPTVAAYTPGCYLFVPGSPAITNCVTEQPYQSVGQTIDSVGDRFMPRFEYRNFGGYESFLVSHTIQIGPGGNMPNPLQTGVRWYELRADANGSSATCDSGTVTLSTTPVVCQTGTINPDVLLFRFLPSIAQDKDGNAAVGYSYSVNLPGTEPGIALSTWDLGTLNAQASEVTIFQGQSEEVTDTTGRGQWGSYSSMTVDPSDDCTFWYVNEYWPTITNWATRIANFKMPTCQ